MLDVEWFSAGRVFMFALALFLALPVVYNIRARNRARASVEHPTSNIFFSKSSDFIGRLEATGTVFLSLLNVYLFFGMKRRPITLRT